MAALGNTTIGIQANTQFPVSASTLSTCQFPLQVNDATVTKLSVYDTTGGNGNMRGLVYNDNGNTPGSLIAATPATSVLGGGTWNDLPFTAPFKLNVGSYWLGVIADGTRTTNSIPTTGLNVNTNDSALFPTLTSPIPASVLSSFQKAIYATFTLPSVFSGVITN